MAKINCEHKPALNASAPATIMPREWDQEVPFTMSKGILREGQGLRLLKSRKKPFWARPAHGLMQEKLAFQRPPRHVWGFYADHQGKIRELYMSEKKRRLCPSLHALSLAKKHPSLFRSYESPSRQYRVILDRQNPEALNRVSG